MGAPKYRIVKGDRVKVIRGNYRDLEGTVLEVLREEGRVRVEGVNQRKRHTRPSQADPDGGIITFEAPIHISNVMLVCPHCKAPSRARRRHDADGTLERLCARCETPIPAPEA